MKKISTLAVSLILAVGIANFANVAKAQDYEVIAYDVDSTDYYNQLYNPQNNDCAPLKDNRRNVNFQKHTHISVNTGMGFFNGGSYSFVNPNVDFDISKKWSLSVGTGVAISDANVLNYGIDGGYSEMKNIVNYYSVGAKYHVSEKLTVYGDLIYGRNFSSSSYKNYYDKDRYSAVFGAVYDINKSLSIGFEVRQSKNMNPYSMPYYRGF